MAAIGNSKPLPARLTVTDGMTWQKIDESGNKAQKYARIIFDGDGNGKYDKTEATIFNNSRVSVKKTSDGTTNVSVYNKNGKLVTTVKIDSEIQSLYDSLNAKQGVSEQLVSISKNYEVDKNRFDRVQKEIRILENQFREKVNYDDIFRELYY